MKQLFLIFFVSLFCFGVLHAQSVEISQATPFKPGDAHGMAVDKNGTLYFADTFRRVNPNSSQIYYLKSPYTGKLQPLGIKGVGLAGIHFYQEKIVVCDLHGSLVHEYDKNLQLLRSWQVQNPWNVRHGHDGALYVITHQGILGRLFPDGRGEVLISGLDAPFDLEVCSDGAIWISEQGVQDGRVSLWAYNGQSYQQKVTTKAIWKNPEGMALDSKGNLWVLDTESGFLACVQEDGSHKIKLNGLGIPIMLKLMPNGNLIATSNRYQGQSHLLEISPSSKK